MHSAMEGSAEAAKIVGGKDDHGAGGEPGIRPEAVELRGMTEEGCAACRCAAEYMRVPLRAPA